MKAAENTRRVEDALMETGDKAASTVKSAAVGKAGGEK